jgi:4-amino-4-deoxy-L-arabinose transferase-like glycosyltransferase
MTQSLPPIDPPSPSVGARSARAIDPLIFGGLFLGYLIALIASAKSIGYARDEGFYFHAAGTYGKWFELLFSNPARALQPAMVDRFWQENHEHPALMKSLFWLSQRLLDGRVPLDTGTTLRLPAMIVSAFGVATTFAFGRRCIGRGAGLFAALSFGLMPSIFHNSHLACFDMPIAALWLFVVYAYQRSLEPRAWGWALACALLYGLALDTKHNSWLLPPAILAHALVLGLPSLIRRFSADVRARAPRPRAPLAIILTALIAPAIFYTLWPWLWHDTKNRLVEYVEFHRQHVYYNIEYLGRTYFQPPFPRSYSWLMTLATVPLITLVLGLLGLLTAGRAALRGGSEAAASDPRAPRSWALLWLLCIVASYFFWLLRDTPIFGGTKHWLSAYPFIALFAGQGFAWLTSLLRGVPGQRLRRALPYALGACTLLGPLVMTWHSVPWGLSAYMPIVGGAPGAATLGLNRSFWGYTTGSVTGYLNQSVGRGERVFLHDTALDSFRMLQRDQRLRRDIKPWGTVAGSRFALYHHEQHMSRVEHMIWVDYGTTTPAHVATYDGVPMIWVYRRP